MYYHIHPLVTDDAFSESNAASNIRQRIVPYIDSIGKTEIEILRHELI